jgi:hypothetical protein
MTEFPDLYKDLCILWNGKWYWGYYEGEQVWRIGLTYDGRGDKFVFTPEIQSWYYLNSL